MEPKIFKVKSIGQGQLFIMPCPKAEELYGTLVHLKQLGVNTVVSMLEEAETVRLGVEAEHQDCANLGLQFEQFPIRDRHNPTNPGDFRVLVEKLYNQLHNGDSVVIHCYAGIGRTGLVAGSLLIQDGLSVGEAVELMSEARGRNMPQTQEQYEYLQDFESGEETGVEIERSRNWFMRWLSPA